MQSPCSANIPGTASHPRRRRKEKDAAREREGGGKEAEPILTGCNRTKTQAGARPAEIQKSSNRILENIHRPGTNTRSSSTASHTFVGIELLLSTAFVAQQRARQLHRACARATLSSLDAHSRGSPRTATRAHDRSLCAIKSTRHTHTHTPGHPLTKRRWAHHT